MRLRCVSLEEWGHYSMFCTCRHSMWQGFDLKGCSGIYVLADTKLDTGRGVDFRGCWWKSRIFHPGATGQFSQPDLTPD